MKNRLSIEWNLNQISQKKNSFETPRNLFRFTAEMIKDHQTMTEKDPKPIRVIYLSLFIYSFILSYNINELAFISFYYLFILLCISIFMIN